MTNQMMSKTARKPFVLKPRITFKRIQNEVANIILFRVPGSYTIRSVGKIKVQLTWYIGWRVSHIRHSGPASLY